MFKNGQTPQEQQIKRCRSISVPKKEEKEKKNNNKKLAKLKTWKGGLGNRERPGGLKTRKGGPSKN